MNDDLPNTATLHQADSEKPKRKPYKKRTLRKLIRRQMHKFQSRQKRYQRIVIQLLTGIAFGLAMIYTTFWVPSGVSKTGIGGIRPRLLPDDMFALLIIQGFAYFVGLALGIIIAGDYILGRKPGARFASLFWIVMGGVVALLLGIVLNDFASPVVWITMLLLSPILGVAAYHLFEPEGVDEDDDE